MILRSKTRNLSHLDHLHTVVIATEKIMLQKNAGAVPMPLGNLNRPKRIIQQKIRMRCKNKEI